MNCSKQPERAGPLFKKSVTIEDIKMLIKILNQKLDVAIKAEFSFSNGDYTNVNTEEMLETKSDSYERVKKSKMSADAAEFVPMSHKIGFNCNGEISRTSGLMKQLANTYADEESPENESYAFTNENNSAGVKLLSEDSREENETVKEEHKQGDENPAPSEENHFVSPELEAKNYVDSCNIDQQPNAEETKMQIDRGLTIAGEDIFESPNFEDTEISNNDEKSFISEICSTKSENENINLCNDYLDKAQILSEEENPQREPFAFDNDISPESKQIFNMDNKNFSALNKNSDDASSTLGCQYSPDICEAKPEDEFQTSSNIQEDQDAELQKHFHTNLMAEKYQKLKKEPEVDIMLGEPSEDLEEKFDEPKTNDKREHSRKDEKSEEFDQANDSIKKEEEEEAEDEEEEEEEEEGEEEEEEEESSQSHQKSLINVKEDYVKNKLQVQIIEAIRCEINSNEISSCKLFEEKLKDKCRQEIKDEDNISNDSIELEIVPETIKCQWNSHLTSRMLAYSLHLKCTELANIYKAWSESTPPILPTKFWSMKKQNSYTMQSIAENISLVCLKCEVVQMKLEAEQQKLKYEEIDKKMQLSFQKESKNTELQKKLEEAWKKATKTEEMLSHKIWAKRKNWFNIFALFYQKPDVIVPRPKTFERARRPFFSSSRERSRLFFRRAWRR